MPEFITRMEKVMLRCFGYNKWMDVSRITTQIYRANVKGKHGKGRPRRTSTRLKMPDQSYKG